MVAAWLLKVLNPMKSLDFSLWPKFLVVNWFSFLICIMRYNTGSSLVLLCVSGIVSLNRGKRAPLELEVDWSNFRIVYILIGTWSVVHSEFGLSIVFITMTSVTSKVTWALEMKLGTQPENLRSTDDPDDSLESEYLRHRWVNEAGGSDAVPFVSCGKSACPVVGDVS